MNSDNRMNYILKNQKGVAAIMVVLGIIAFLGIVALAVDIGYRNVAQNELQNIVDAAALAGAGELSRQYLDPAFVSVNDTLIEAMADDVADKNASGFTIQVEIGTWIDRATGFDPTPVTRPNAVRATARRGNPGGVSNGNPQIPTFFARIWNIFGLDAQADAVAALTGSTEIDKADLEIPVGISYEWFQGEFCNRDIQFYPTAGTDGCAGWHVYESWPANAQKLRDDILGSMIDGTWNPTGTYEFDPTCPDGTPDNNDVEFSFTGGNLSTTQDNIAELYDNNQVAGVWETQVVIYCEPCGENPNQTVTIIGVATVKITGVLGPPPVLTASIECGQLTPGAGGGNYYGTWGSIPGLVE